MMITHLSNYIFSLVLTKMPARACRGCLATDQKLYNIYKNNLYEVFGEVVGNPIFESDNLPQHICSVCYTQLKKFVSFRTRCVMVQDLLDDLQLQGVKLTTKFITSIDRSKYNLLLNLSTCIPPEGLVIEHEEEVPIPDDIQDSQEPEPLSPLTEDVPLPPPTTIDTEKQKKDVQSKRRKKFDDPKYIEDFERKYNAKIEILSLDKQIEELKIKVEQVSSNKRIRTSCIDCGKALFSEESLQSHIKMCHDESAGPEQCEVCLCRFTSKQLAKHVLIHKLKITCRQCDVRLSTPYKAVRHYHEHNMPKEYNIKCNYCREKFDKKASLNDHIKLEHPDKLLWCKCCGETLVHIRGLAFHMRKVHSDLLKHKCQECNVKFASLEALYKHLHTTSELHVCVMCGDSFKSDSLLKDHVVKEHARSKFIRLAHCDGCGVKFFGTEPLSKHLEENSCGNGSPCQLCGVTFPNSQVMEDHKHEFHTKVYRACESCDKAFDSHNYRHHILRVHNIKPPAYQRGISELTATKMWSVHGNIIKGVSVSSRSDPLRTGNDEPKRNYICEQCGNTFHKHEYLKVHMRVHSGERPYKCQFCGKGYIRKSSLQGHELLHTGERPHACHVCPKQFRKKAALLRHLTCHSGLRRHICRVCDKSFRTSTCVKTHIKAVHLNIPVRGPRKREFMKQTSMNPNIFIAQNSTEQGNDKSEDASSDEEGQKSIVLHSKQIDNYRIIDLQDIADTAEGDSEVPARRITKIVNLRRRKPNLKNMPKDNENKYFNTHHESSKAVLSIQRQMEKDDEEQMYMDTSSQDFTDDLPTRDDNETQELVYSTFNRNVETERLLNKAKGKKRGIQSMSMPSLDCETEDGRGHMNSGQVTSVRDTPKDIVLKQDIGGKRKFIIVSSAANKRTLNKK